MSYCENRIAYSVYSRDPRAIDISNDGFFNQKRGDYNLMIYKIEPFNLV